MDPWKPIRLWLWIGVMLALLAAGVYGRLYPLPARQFSSNNINDWSDEEIWEWFRIPPLAGPFHRLELDFARHEGDVQRARPVELRD